MARDYYSSSSYSQAQPPLPIHLCFFIIILVMFIGFSWYINYEPVLESVFEQVKLFLMMSPLVLVLAVHWLSNNERRFSHLIPLPAEKESLHRAGGTPWGVAFLLVLLFFMISYHSSFQERWFPLLSR